MATYRRSRPGTRSAAPKRKFVWARLTGQVDVGSFDVLVDLLSQFQTEYGAQLLGSTVTRIRGIAMPFTSENISGTASGVTAFRVGRDSEVASDTNNGYSDNVHADYFGVQPWAFTRSDMGPFIASTAGTGAGSWDIDVKANRKIEELGQTAYMVVQVPDTFGLSYRLSVGLKLP